MSQERSIKSGYWILFWILRERSIKLRYSILDVTGEIYKLRLFWMLQERSIKLRYSILNVTGMIYNVKILYSGCYRIDL